MMTEREGFFLGADPRSFRPCSNRCGACLLHDLRKPLRCAVDRCLPATARLDTRDAARRGATLLALRLEPPRRDTTDACSRPPVAACLSWLLLIEPHLYADASAKLDSLHLDGLSTIGSRWRCQSDRRCQLCLRGGAGRPSPVGSGPWVWLGRRACRG
jgi:hypothetical protein